MQAYTEEDLLYLREKIEEMRIARFHPEFKSEITLPNNIIEVLKVDVEGNLYFLTSAHNSNVEALDKTFYAELDFHRKGSSDRLSLRGWATIEDDGVNELVHSSNYSFSVANRLVLVKYRIQHADYKQGKPQVEALVPKLRYLFSQLFLETPDREFHFS